METVYWNTPGLRVTHLRLTADRGFPVWNVARCEGTLKGEPVKVSLPFEQLDKTRGKRAKSLGGQIVDYAMAEGVHARRLGILDAISTKA